MSEDLQHLSVSYLTEMLSLAALLVGICRPSGLAIKTKMVEH